MTLVINKLLLDKEINASTNGNGENEYLAKTQRLSYFKKMYAMFKYLKNTKPSIKVNKFGTFI